VRECYRVLQIGKDEERERDKRVKETVNLRETKRVCMLGKAERVCVYVFVCMCAGENREFLCVCVLV